MFPINPAYWAEYLRRTVRPYLPESLQAFLDGMDITTFMFVYAAFILIVFSVVARVIVRQCLRAHARLKNHLQ